MIHKDSLSHWFENTTTWNWAWESAEVLSKVSTKISHGMNQRRTWTSSWGKIWFYFSILKNMQSKDILYSWWSNDECYTLEYPKLELKYPLHCYIAANTLRHFSRKNWIYEYEVFWITLQAF